MLKNEQIQHKLNNKTKPIGSLGVLEDIALKICKIQKTLTPSVENATILIFAGDHGLSNNPISCYPQEVTKQMVYNFLSGGAAINVFCRLNAIDLKVIDSGVIKIDHNKTIDHEMFVNMKIADGTKSSLTRQAISDEQLSQCFRYGRKVINNHIQQHTDIIGFGEMGIGNTSASSLIASRILDLELEECIGKGTGLSSMELIKKIEVLKKVDSFHQTAKDPLEILKAYGGFEMAQMVSAMLEAFLKNKILLIDGFISTACFLIAYKLNPKIMENTLFSHCSDEHAHRRILNILNVRPILDLKLRLGEGTGAALAYPLIKASCEFMNEMSSFDDAKVSTRNI